MMHMADVVRAIAEHRGDAIVIPGRSGRHWAPISDTVFDLPMGDPAMGGHAGFGLGVALAQPNRRVILLDSEGDILMSLGMLATIAEQAPANFYHFVLDNEVYATTGGQPVPNAKQVAYDVLARGAGYPRAFAFTELDALASELPGILRAPGPVFVTAKVFPEIENEPIHRRVRWRKRTADKVVADLRNALAPPA
jgi:thiamine pyrophosphate-dependent acetolactate synthase large subunit-like protein